MKGINGGLPGAAPLAAGSATEVKQDAQITAIGLGSKEVKQDLQATIAWQEDH